MAGDQQSFRKDVREASVIQWNARGLRSRISDFRQYVFSNRFPIIVICEPKLSNPIRLSGYESIPSKTRNESSKVIVYIRRELTYIIQPVSPHDENQYICLTVKQKTLTFTLIGVYLSPSARFDCQRLDDILSSVPDPWIIIGDFNAHHPIWGSSKVNTTGRRLASFVSTHELSLLNDGSPTFLRGSTYSSCLDLTFVSRRFATSVKWFLDIETHGSDHIPSYLTIEGFASDHPPKTVRRIDLSAFTTNIEHACEKGLTSGIEQAIKQAAQSAMRTLAYSSRPSETDMELERLRAIRRRAERRYRRTKSIQDLRMARRMQKKIQRRIDKLEFQRWAKFCASLDPRKPLSQIWRTVRGLRIFPQQRFPFKALALFQNRRDIEVAEDFCRKIAGPPNCTEALTADYTPHSLDPHLDLPFSMEELNVALASCNRSSSPGPDGISYRLLCNLGDRARSALLEVFNESWRDGTVPREWKTSRLVALLKPGKSPLELTSYRPIALASCVGKLMERMILARLEWFLERHRIYPDAMAGFRRLRSSIDNVIDLVTYVQHQKMSRRLSVALFLDVKGAYDNVSHEAILDALESVGLGGRVYRWIQCYLHMRSLFMQTDDGPTSEHYTHRGVPQGGVLSPTLFNLVLIGLVERIPDSVQISLYADDICAWTSGVTRPQVRARLQKAANSISAYLREQGLEISPEKSALVAFTRKAMTSFPITIDGHSVCYARTHRFLGVTIDRNLCWSPHVATLKKRLTAIAQLFKFLGGKTWGTSVHAMLHLYKTLFLGYLRYSLPVLTNACKSSIRTIENAQGQALRVCLGLPRCTSTAETIAIAKDHPATVHITLEVLRAHIRHLARAPAHHLASLPEDRPSASFCKRVLTFRECLPTVYTPPERILTPPWCLDRPKLRLTVPGIRKKAELSAPALKQMILLMLHEEYKDHVKLYTDGSTTVGGSAGAVIFPARAETIQFRTSHKTTSTAVELAALRSALRRIDQETPQKWSIFTDSKPALQCLHNALRRGPQDQLALEIRQLYHHLIDEGHDISFQWLPGHCGIIGNEHADNAAKNAHENGVMEPIPLSRSDAAAKINTLAQDVARSMRNTPGFLHTRLHRLDPCLRLTIPSGLPRSETTLLCRMWLGVSFTNAFACRIGMRDSATCDHCDNDETIEHILCQCPQYSSQRQSLSAVFARLDDQPFSEQSILECRKDRASRQKATKALMKFLRATRLVERL